MTPLAHTEVVNTDDVEKTDGAVDVEWCLACQAPVVTIAYGFPGPEMFEAAERGEIVLGGCTIDTGNPTRTCPCGATTHGHVEPASQGGPAEAFSLDEARSHISNRPGFDDHFDVPLAAGLGRLERPFGITALRTGILSAS